MEEVGSSNLPEPTPLYGFEGAGEQPSGFFCRVLGAVATGERQVRRLVDDVAPLCYEYYGMHVEAPDQECLSPDGEVCGV